MTPMIASPETLEGISTPGGEIAQAKRAQSNGQHKSSERGNDGGVDETLYLIGRPTLKQFLRFARNNAVNSPDDGTLTDEWQAANDVLRALEKEEAGAPDNPPITKME